MPCLRAAVIAGAEADGGAARNAGRRWKGWMSAWPAGRDSTGRVCWGFWQTTMHPPTARKQMSSSMMMCCASLFERLDGRG